MIGKTDRAIRLSAQYNTWLAYRDLVHSGADEGGVLWGLRDEIERVRELGLPYSQKFRRLLARLSKRHQ